MHALVEFLRGQPVIVLFLLLGCGDLVGRIRIAGFAFGSVAGTLLVAIFLGQYGLRISPGAQAVGFALFIFSVGYQAGPRFFEIMKTEGLKYLLLSLFVVGIGVLTTVAGGRLLSLPPGANAGLLAGALTSSPALAAAQDTVRSGLATLPAGWSTERILSSIGTSYAITYVVGTLGIVALVGLFPRLIGLDLEAAARQLELQDTEQGAEPLQARAYRVENPQFCTPTLAELGKRYWDGLAVVRIRRGLAWLAADPDAHLAIGDEIYAYGDAGFFRAGIDRAGPEIRILGEMELSASLTHVVIARRGAVGRDLRSLDLARKHGLVVCEVKRDGYRMPVTRELVLQRGDVLTVVGPVWGLKALPEVLGPVEANPVETDMTTFVFGIALGGAVGLLAVTVGGIPITLGTAGGLIVLGILVGWLNSTRPTIGRFPDAARWILSEFGLLVFIASVGLGAGDGILETLRTAGLGLGVMAALVVALPLALGYLFGRRVLGLEPVVLLGALTGAMTSGPALGLVMREAKSPVPALGYTGTYAVASILLTIAGTALMHL